MRKKVFGRKLSRGRGARKALFRSLVRSLLLNNSIKTTKIKAKSIQGSVDKLITTSRKGDVAAKRSVMATLGNDKEAFNKLFSSIIPSVGKRTSGFTRIVTLPKRKGDGAEVAILEFVDKIEKNEKVEASTKEPKKVSKKPKSVAKEPAASGKQQVKS